MWGRGQRNTIMKYGEGAPESPLSIGPERPCYATAVDDMQDVPFLYILQHQDYRPHLQVSKKWVNKGLKVL